MRHNKIEKETREKRVERRGERESIRQLLGSEVLGFLLVDVLHEDSLVLEHISLHLQIELVVPGRERERRGERR